MEPDDNYRGHNHQPLVPILSQTNPIPTLPSYFFTVHFNISPVYVDVFQVASFLQGLPPKPCMLSLVSMWPICPAHLTLLHLITVLIFGDEKKWSSSLCSFLQPPVTSSLLGPHIPLSTLLPLCEVATSHLTCYCSCVQQNSQQYKNMWYCGEQGPSHFSSTVFRCMLSKSTLCSFSPLQEFCSEQQLLYLHATGSALSLPKLTVFYSFIV